MSAPYPVNWELDDLLPGGPTGDAFEAEFKSLTTQSAGLLERSRQLSTLDADTELSKQLLFDAHDLQERGGQLYAVVSCYASADTEQVAYRKAEGRLLELWSQIRQIFVGIDAAIAATAEAAFEALVSDPDLEAFAPGLRHKRDGAKLRYDPALEDLAVAMERESLGGWGQLYNEISGKLKATLEIDGEQLELSMGQLRKYAASPHRAHRQETYRASNAAWQTVEDLCAAALTNITGARQTRNDRLGLTPLSQTLHDNRIERETLEAIRTAVGEVAPTLLPYTQRKAQLLGLDKLELYDVMAPLGDAKSAKLSWEDATSQVHRAFRGYHPELAEFADRALRKGWVESENRGGKRQGGFCTDIPLNKESRIFMTYTGTVGNALTLAHELGHAYHNEVLYTQPPARRHITSALAESASTFAEAVFRDQLLETAEDTNLRLFMLDQMLQAGVVFTMLIPSRFEMELKLYELRRQGPLDAATLIQQGLDIQKRCYHDALGSYSQRMWASTLHFYISSFGFYNWPYTFGYLFSSALYQRYKQEGPAFHETLKELLQWTGWASSEAIGRELLGADLRDPGFWRDAAKPLAVASERFLAETESLV